MKRAIDVAVSAVLLIALSPVMLAVAATIALGMGRPVFFTDRRPGLGGKLFTFHKFRTMRVGAPGESDEARLTPLGRALRRASLDELPQLWNVLRGDMSLVGPRPLLSQYLDRYTAEQHRRHDVRPGITGLAQVSGRNALSWEERFAHDVWYVDHQSLRLDLWILWRTVVAVVSGTGISADGHATMPEFMGTATSNDRRGRQCATS